MPASKPAAGYEAFCGRLRIGDEKARSLLRLHSIYINSCEFDPASGAGLPMYLDSFLAKFAHAVIHGHEADRLERIIRHCDQALKSILAQPATALIREHAMLPLYAVREVDNITIQWLSTRPGRTMRQKFCSSRHALAPRRRWTLNTAENRLLKAFLKRLLERMECRARALGGKARSDWEEWRNRASRWLGQDEAKEVGAWENLPPNNILLSHKHYRKIWDAWNWLQELDQQTDNDFEKIAATLLEGLFWHIAAWLREGSRCRLLQQACRFHARRLRVAFGDGENPDRELALHGRYHIDDSWKPLSLALKNGSIELWIGDSQFMAARSLPEGVEITTAGDSYPCAGASEFNELLNLGTDAEKEEYASGNICALNLCKLRPEYRLDGAPQKELPFRLLAQSCDGFIVDCGRAKAARLDPDEKLLSFHDIFTRGEDDSLLAAAAQLFFQRLSGFLRCGKLIAVAPDYTDEFQQGIFNKFLRLYFPNAQAIPHSVATALSAQKKNDAFFKNNDKVLLLIAAVYGENLILTPLMGIKEETIAKMAPESHGFTWERHPATAFALPRARAALNAMLARAGLPQEANPFTIRDIEELAENFSLFPPKNGDPQNALDLSEREKDAMERLLAIIDLDGDQVSAIIERIPGAKGTPTRIVPGDLKATLRGRGLPGVHFPVRSLAGAAALGEWQKKIPGAVFWKDHLPALGMRASVNGAPMFYPLVQNLPVIPVPGKAINIPLDKLRITLAGGCREYRFPLQREEGGEKLRYQAILASRCFPLAEDTECRLKLSYTYGAERPYQLEFQPIDISLPEKLVAQWQGAVMRLSPAPGFPEVDTWQDLRNHPGRHGAEDDIQKILSLFNELRQMVLFFQGSPETRRVYYRNFNASANWKGDFCFLPLADGREVFVHKNNFFDREGIPVCPLDAVNISFNIVDNPKRPGSLVAKHIAEGRRLPPLNEFLKKFCSYTRLIWNFGRSLKDADAPQELREGTSQFLEDFAWLIKNRFPKREEVELYLSGILRMREDAPDWAWNHLDKEWPTGRSAWETGYVLGACNLPRQKDLLERVMKCLDSERRLAIGILARAAWREAEFIHKFSKDSIADLANSLLAHLHKRLNLLEMKKSDIEAESLSRIGRELKDCCELLLALMRTRASADAEIAEILDSNNQLSEKFRDEITRLERLQAELGFKMRSFVAFDLNKPATCASMPDILYAVGFFLNGEEEATDIKITIKEEDEQISSIGDTTFD